MTIELDLNQQYQRMLAEMRAGKLEKFDEKTLAWLVLVPGWTIALAQAAQFPFGKWKSAENFIEFADESGVIEVEKGNGKTDFWVSTTTRTEILTWLREQSISQNELLKYAQIIGRNVVNLTEDPSTNIEISKSVTRWATMANWLNEGINYASDRLDQQISELIKEDRSGEVISWLDEARSLADLAGGSLESTVRLGNRKLELKYRQAQDMRHLESFLRREEQVHAFHNLLQQVDGAWGLHYLGMGGVGKTMLLRYISAGMPDEPEDRPKPEYISCRIDFDYISPDFPMRKPGQLLLELVAELRLFGLEARNLQRFNIAVNQLHNHMGTEPLVQNLKDRVEGDTRLADSFQQMIDAFYEILLRLAKPERPIVLILDTCEELAKFQPVDMRLPGIEATFYILESLYNTHSNSGNGSLPFRVIFAGRRPIAQRGYRRNGQNWDWEIQASQGDSKRALLPEEKDYLALHELRGFDAKEAHIFLHECKNIETIPEEIQDKILKSSVETGRSAEIIRAEEYNYSPDIRYNPFDLSIFADWLKSNPKLSIQEISQNSQDPYIEFRILKRLREHALEQMLPYLVLLERFDKSVIKPLLEKLQHENYEAIFRELGDQEWIDYDYDEVTDSTFLKVDTNFLSRLRKYYGVGDGDIKPDRKRQVEEAKTILSPILETVIAEASLTTLSIDYISAALRVMPSQQAAEMWKGIEVRIPSEADWNWVHRALGRLLGGEEYQDPNKHPMWSSVQAMYISALLHINPTADLRSMWDQIYQACENHPLEAEKQKLALRATLGRIATTPYKTKITQPDTIKIILNSAFQALSGTGTQEPNADEQIFASACAAMENILDSLEYHGNANQFDLFQFENLFDNIQEVSISPALEASLYTSIGRAIALRPEVETDKAALHILDFALKKAQETNALEEQHQKWFDWVLPESQEYRIALEILKHSPEVMPQAVESTYARILHSEHIKTIDQDRFTSKAIAKKLAHMPIPENELKQLLKVFQPIADQPSCLAHDNTSPLFLSLAKGFLALGRASKAREILGKVRVSGSDVMIAQAQSGLIEIDRRMRLRNTESLLRNMISSNEVNRLAAAYPAAVLNGIYSPNSLPITNADKMPPDVIHAWNQCQPNSEEMLNYQEIDPQEWLNFASNHDRLLLNLYLMDKDTLLTHFDLFEKKELYFPISEFKLNRWLENHPNAFESAFRIGLHHLLHLDYLELLYLKGLVDGPIKVPNPDLGDTPEYMTSLYKYIPIRRRAEIALEEGELIALRDPQQAVHLLKLAETWFSQCNDPVGKAQARLCLEMARVRDHVDPDKFKQSEGELVQFFLDAAPLDEIPANLLEELPPDFDHPDWKGWWKRLAFCLRYPREELWPFAPGNDAELKSFFESGVPAEMTFKSDRRGNFWQKLIQSLSLDNIFTVLIVLIFIAVVVGGLVGLYSVYYSGLRAVNILQSAPAWQRFLGFCVTFVVVYNLLSRVRKFIAQIIAAQAKVNLKVESYEGEEANYKLEIQEWLIPPIIRRTKTQKNWTAPLPDETKPTAESADFPAKEDLNNLMNKLGSRSTQLPITSDERRVQAKPWEAYLGSMFENLTPGKVMERFHIYRHIPVMFTPHWAQDASWHLGFVRLVCSPNYAYILKQAWSNLTENIVDTVDLSFETSINIQTQSSDIRTNQVAKLVLKKIIEDASNIEEFNLICDQFEIHIDSSTDDWDLMLTNFVEHVIKKNITAEVLTALQIRNEEKNYAYKVLQLIGEPLLDRGEYFWQIASAGATESFYQQKSFSEQEYFGNLIPLGNISNQLTSLVVLQLELLDDPQPQRVDEFQMTPAREFAAALVEQGARAVLVIPSLPFDLAEAAILTFAQALRNKYPSDINKLLQAVQAMRKAIVGWKKDDASTETGESNDNTDNSVLENIASEICLFIPSEVNLEEWDFSENIGSTEFK